MNEGSSSSSAGEVYSSQALFNACDVAVDIESAATYGQYGPRFQTFNQYNQNVDLCEFSQGKPIVIALSAEWCSPCIDIAREVSTGGGATWFPNELMVAIDRGDVVFVDLITAVNKGPVDQIALQSWHQKHPHDKVILLADSNEKLINHIGKGSFPDFVLLDSNYRWQMIRTGGTDMFELLDILNENIRSVGGLGED